jgi:hypothetical protein
MGRVNALNTKITACNILQEGKKSQIIYYL